MNVRDLLPQQKFILKRTGEKYLYIDDGNKKTKHRVLKLKEKNKTILSHQCQVTPCE